jgi:hypothetical protein
MPCAFGTVTTRAAVTPAPEYNVEVPVPALFTHHGVAAPRASPQVFLRCVSTVTAVPLAFAGWGMRCRASELTFKLQA